MMQIFPRSWAMFHLLDQLKQPSQFLFLSFMVIWLGSMSPQMTLCNWLLFSKFLLFLLSNQLLFWGMLLVVLKLWHICKHKILLLIIFKLPMFLLKLTILVIGYGICLVLMLMFWKEMKIWNATLLHWVQDPIKFTLTLAKLLK